MKFNFKFLSLLLWVTQFGLSVMFPLCVFLMLAVWLRGRFDLGLWIIIVLGLLGFVTSVQTARSCLRSLQKEVEQASENKKPPVAFNDHD